MSKTTNKFSPEFRARAVRMLLEQEREPGRLKPRNFIPFGRAGEGY